MKIPRPEYAGALLRRAWLVAAVALVLDQASKWAILHLLDLPSVGWVVVVPGYLNFALLWNTGVNFGLFAAAGEAGRWLLLAIPVLASVALSWWLYRRPGTVNPWGVGLIIGGALGNALDRLVHGAVLDFLNVTVPPLHNPWAFNVADIWVVLGVGLVVIGRGSRRMPVSH